MKLVWAFLASRRFISKSRACLPIVVVTASGVLLLWWLLWIGGKPINLLQVQGAFMLCYIQVQGAFMLCYSFPELGLRRRHNIWWRRA